VRKLLHVSALLAGDRLTVTAQAQGEKAVAELSGPFPTCKDQAAMDAAVRAAFGRLGDSSFELATLSFCNDMGGFVPLSKLNQVRRDVLSELQGRLAAAQGARVASIQDEVCRPHVTPAMSRPSSEGHSDFRWSIKVDRAAFLEEFDKEDWGDVDEVIIDITRDHPTLLQEKLARLGDQVGRERIRLALPALTRQWEEKPVLHKVQTLRAAGWRKWEAANLSAWNYLGLDATDGDTGDLDLATDWSVYVLNRLAALQLVDMGVSRFALSPEDGLANWKSLVAEFGPRAVVIVYQDTPLFLAESCAYANLIGGCPGKANCGFETMDMVSSHGEKVTALDYHCRTIVLNQGPFCLSGRLKDLAQAGAISLRADFIYRPYEPSEVRTRWRLVRAGQTVRGGHAANLDRGML
jgi:hypothetical protein